MFINVAKKPEGLIGKSYDTIYQIVTDVLEEIKFQKPIRSSEIGEAKRKYYRSINTYIGHRSGLYICEFLDNLESRNGILIASRNPTETVKKQIESVQPMSEIQINGGYIFLGQEKSRQVLVFECPNDGKEEKKLNFKMIIPNNNRTDWEIEYKKIQCENIIIYDGDRKLREKMDIMQLGNLFKILEREREILRELYGDAAYKGKTH